MASSSDRVLREKKNIQFFQLGPIKLSAPKKTKAEINRDYYARIKADDEKYKDRLKIQKERSKKNREETKSDQVKLERSRKLAAERVRKYRQRMKEKEAKEVDKIPKKLTRKDAEMLANRREKDRLRKQAERAKWSHQKKKAENKKAKDRYHRKKGTTTNISVGDTGSDGRGHEDQDTSNRSSNARYQALHRVVSQLPKNTIARQETLTDLIKKVGSETPDTVNPLSLARKDRKFSKELIRRLWVSKKHDKKGVFRTAKTLFGLSRSRVSYHIRTNINKKVNKKQEAVNFFYAENSRTLSEKRHSQKKEASGVLEEPIQELHKKFVSESGITVSRSFFFKHRPKNVKKMSDVKFNQSLCEICENFRLLCKSLGSVNALFNKSKQHIIESFLCKKEGPHHKSECIERKCKSCQLHNLESLILPEEVTKAVTCHQWLYRETDRGVKRKVLVSEETTVQGCVDMFVDQMKTMPKHLFHAQWQYNMFLDQQKFVKPRELVTVMDFAENYRCANQDEVQAAYWNYQQATIHPMVNYFRCSACNNVMTAAVIVISDDLQHDHHAVEVFYTKNLDHFKKANIDLNELTQWSDGCGTQYKSKGPFARLQTAPARYNVRQVNRHFFGSRHGKNPSDGVSANVKNKATRAVRCRRAVIQNAEELFKFLRDNMTVTSDGCNRHNSRHFIFVHKEEVRREIISCVPLKGTRQVHSLKANESGDCLLYRNLTCNCQGCTESDGTTCANSLHVKEWQRQDMIQTKSSDKEPTPEESTATTDPENTAESRLELLNETKSSDKEPTPEESTATTDPENTAESRLELLNETKSSDKEPTPEESTATTDPENTAESRLELLNETRSSDKEPTPEENTETTDLENTADSSLGLLSQSAVDLLEELNEGMDTESVSITQAVLEKLAPSEEPTEQSLMKNTDTIFPGGWVAASFPGKIQKVYLGTVLEVDGNEASVKFCRQHGNYFTWPAVEDIGWMPLYSLTAVEAPILNTRGKMTIDEAALIKYFN